MPAHVTFKGNPLTLLGAPLRVGNLAYDFTLFAGDLSPVTLDGFKGKVKVVTTFPSIDTPVCDLQVKEFNKRAAGLSSEVAVIGVSKDLPFAQQRFCTEFDIAGVKVVSAYRDQSFAVTYGLLIKELNLLARSVFILDRNNVVRYVQVVKEVTSPPDYDDAIKALDTVLKTPALDARDALPVHCAPCQIGTPALPAEKAAKLMAQVPGWELVEGKKLVKELKFPDFDQAKCALDVLSVFSQAHGHHPSFLLGFGKLKVTLSTHAAGGLTENDFIMARVFDRALA